MIYRRKAGDDTWHWCTNCSDWPTYVFFEQSTKPSKGKLCIECRAKDKGQNCTKTD